eukprot:scaffold8.g1640.t1
MILSLHCRVVSYQPSSLTNPFARSATMASGTPPLEQGPAPLEDIQQEEMSSLDFIEPVYGTKLAIHPAAMRRLPEHSMPAYMAKAIIQDMRSLDFNPRRVEASITRMPLFLRAPGLTGSSLRLPLQTRLNLSTFINSWVEEEAQELMVAALPVNQADAVQYPSTIEMEKRCVRMLAHLWHAPSDDFFGTATVGSTEACYLGGLAMKLNWRAARRAAGLPADRPNIVLSHIAQVCWKKFCVYFDVEPRFVEVSEELLVGDPAKMKALCDENTIGVVAMFASTYTGQLEDVAGFDKALEELKQARESARIHLLPQEKGWDIPIHVDAANAGLVIPLIRPELVWDFQLSHVMSINFSGHKYGGTFCGCAFVVFREQDWVPSDMIFVVDYLGEQEANLTINFSRPAAQIVGQYYQFLRLGREGFRRIFANLFSVYNYLKDKLEQTGEQLLVLWEGGRPYNEYDIMHRLQQFRWMVPAYVMAPAASHIHLMRVCIRVGFDLEMAEKLVADLVQVVAMLDKHTSRLVESEGQAFLKEQEERQKDMKQHAGPC